MKKLISIILAFFMLTICSCNANNDIKSVKILRMEVPCCGGLENAVKRALQASGKFLPWQVVTITTDGKILE